VAPLKRVQQRAAPPFAGFDHETHVVVQGAFDGVNAGNRAIGTAMVQPGGG
jgi:hypothetical protein